MPEKFSGIGGREGAAKARVEMLNEIERRYLEKTAEAERRLGELMMSSRTKISDRNLDEFDERMRLRRAERDEVHRDFLSRMESQRREAAESATGEAEDPSMRRHREADLRRAALAKLDALERESIAKQEETERKLNGALDTLREQVPAEERGAIEGELRRHHAASEDATRRFLEEIRSLRAEHAAWLERFDLEAGRA